jgi:hypothetical protein
MSTSTAAHDLAGIKHALELGLILGALVLAVAAHGETTLTCDFKAAPEIAAMHTPGSATFLLNSYFPGVIGGRTERVFVARFAD